ncbi:MAG: transcriptional regulator, MarR family [Rhizobacter sp.]|nr:transcriptional regulator, MarR family [Rhizobacter sp.]
MARASKKMGSSHSEGFSPADGEPLVDIDTEIDPPIDAAPPIGMLAQEYIAVLVLSLAGRLNRGASSFYSRHFDIGMTEFRIILALGLVKGLNVGEVAAAADVDKAAASRSLRLLEGRGIVELEQTNTRGRAAIVHLSKAGAKLEGQIRKAAKQRDKQLTESFSDDELAQALAVIRRLIASVPNMNKE